ncbi:MAG TPA: hydantoinase/oxoprolinase family protein [Streptomyces sp.]|uniref:hydantoinase/oxoprolinase family protein n=1 Tax=Streptomyces sp. TaxID=1931 RepID=UPI002C52F3CB|nr:hydantoinase/oxoprolinase family protein [Streptomyces sp.]HWU12235.1 hydantoinase/oxoprolinase family protein [Streptomyces sp.]
MSITITEADHGFVIGVDIGGTFTDCAIVRPDGSAVSGKTPTTPENRATGFFASIADAAGHLGMSLDEVLGHCSLLIHGTTTGTNALIERDGARTGLITTSGHGDATLIMKAEGRLAGVDGGMIWDLPHTDKPEPIVPRRLIREVHERVDFRGEVLVPMNEQQLLDAADDLVTGGAESIAVSFLWSVRNPAHENRAVELISARHPGVFVTAASSVSSYVGEYERTMSGIVNAYIGPLMREYVRNIQEEANAHGYRGRILYATCAGGAITEAEARTAPVRTVHSGPVSGLLGSAFVAAVRDEPDLIVADMGGTSFDVSVIRGLVPDARDTSMLERFEVSLPMIYIDTVGAGGGSIAFLDAAGNLQVGPRSAGAVPGPVCYGMGGSEPTVTDADVVLGIIGPEDFLHGERRLDKAAAEAAIGALGKPLGLTPEETAAGINRIIDSKMADLLRRMSILRGFDPREFTVFAYGGGGPVHVGAVAREVGVRKVIVPVLHMASAWSAFGATVADVIHVAERWDQHPMPAEPAALAATFAELETEVRDKLASEGFSPEEIQVDRSLRMKYTAQLHNIEVPLTTAEPDEGTVSELGEEFARLYDDLHGEGAGYREGGVTVTGFVVRARGLTVRPAPAEAPPASNVRELSRRVYWSEKRGYLDTPVLKLSGGRVDGRFEGPMLIELPDTVVVIRPGQVAAFDRWGNLVLEIG